MGIIEKMRLDGKKGFVTGAARGIGKCTATAFAEAGADVAIVDLDFEEAQKTAKELAEKTGRKFADYFDKKGYLKVSHKESTLFTLLYEFYLEKNFKDREIFVEYLKYDYLMLGKTGFYPEWFKSEKDGELYDEIIREGNYKSIREGHKNSELERFSYNIFTKEFEDIYVFFDYRNKSTRVIKNNREEK